MRCVLDRVKSFRTLTLPYQKTSPDGVICGGKRLEVGFGGVFSQVLYCCFRL